MADRKYYVLCQSNCKFESMTKEQILTAISEAISTGEIKDVDSGFVTTLKEQNGGAGVKLWVGSTAEYNAAVKNGVDLTNAFCILTDDTTEEDIAANIEAVRKKSSEQESRITSVEELFYMLIVEENVKDATTVLNVSLNDIKYFVAIYNNEFVVLDQLKYGKDQAEIFVYSTENAHQIIYYKSNTESGWYCETNGYKKIFVVCR